MEWDWTSYLSELLVAHHLLAQDENTISTSLDVGEYDPLIPNPAEIRIEQEISGG